VTGHFRGSRRQRRQIRIHLLSLDRMLGRRSRRDPTAGAAWTPRVAWHSRGRSKHVTPYDMSAGTKIQRV
jgi:hypothetical protein